MGCSQSPLWHSLENGNTTNLSYADFQRKRRQFLMESYRHKLREKQSKLLSQCRNKLAVDPILWLPMTRSERSRCLRWRFGWLPHGKPQTCPFHPSELFTRKHSISCLQVHRRLCMPHTIEDPISYLLNLLPVNFLTKKARQSIDGWLIRWPTICAILLEMDCLAHSQVPEPSDHLGEPLLLHLHQVQQQYSDN